MKLRTLVNWRAFVVIAIAGLAVALTATPASAKGADQATITGPGISQPIVVGGDGEPGSGEALGQLADNTGLFVAMFGPDGGFGAGMTSTKPTGALGPRFTVTYRVPNIPKPDIVRQDVYPLAATGPYTFTPGGQRAMGTTTPEGWYHAPGTLRVVLKSIGVPGMDRATPTAAAGVGAAQPRGTAAAANPAPAANDQRGANNAWLGIAGSAAGVCVVLTLGAWWFMRRSSRPRLRSSQ